MIRSIQLSLVAFALTTSTILAQGFGIPAERHGPDYRHASTAAEGYLSGVARLRDAQGRFNYNTAMGLRHLALARQQEIHNSVDAVQATFDRREINRQARFGNRITQEQVNELNRRRIPDRLAATAVDPFTGRMNWPVALRHPGFAAQRREIETRFANRIYGECENSIHLKNAVSRLHKDLQANVRTFDCGQYVAAKRFLASLAYESQQPAFATGAGLAAR